MQQHEQTTALEHLYAELFEAAGQARRFGEWIASQHGQTQARWQTMWIIAAGESLTVPQVARRLGVSRQNVQRVVNDLLSEGIAEQVPNPDHRTSPLVRLTPEGKVVLAGINHVAADAHRALLTSFSAEDVAALRSLLQHLTRATGEHFDV